MTIGDTQEIMQISTDGGNIEVYVTREEVGTYFYHGADRPLYELIGARIVNTTANTVTFLIRLEDGREFTYQVDPPGTSVTLTNPQRRAAANGYAITVLGY